MALSVLEHSTMIGIDRRQHTLSRSFALLFLVCVLASTGCRSLPEHTIEALDAITVPAGPAIDLPDASGGDVMAASPASATPGADDDSISTSTDSPARSTPGALSERVRAERLEAFNPYVITAHRHNYMLPVSYTSALNEAVYRETEVPLREGLQPAEVKFQISLKTQLNEKDLFLKDDSLSFGITLEAWWQLYSSDLSSPFRETDYEPEIMYLKPLLWGPFGGSTAVLLGVVHQSNGQVQGLSRSWNRVYAALLYERGNLVASFKPWLRIPEKKKENTDDPEGDDNPDILDYMGHGEVALSWRDERFEYGVRGRGNPATGKGALTLGLTFQLTGKFRGFIQYFNGYGDSLIDYDHFQTRVGLGVALTNLF